MMNLAKRLLLSARLRSALVASVLGLLLIPSLSGCAIFAQAMQALPDIKPAVYKNLNGQSVAVVVWAEDNGTRIDWPKITYDIGQMVEAKLYQSQKDDKPKELEKTTFPVSVAKVSRMQDENPEWAMDGIEEIAPRLGVSRVINIEIHNFQTREDAAVELFRGTISATVSVIEVSNGHGHVAFTDDTLKISFPKTTPDEGLPNIGDFAIYRGTLDGFTTEVVKLFVPHGDDPDAEYTKVLTAADKNKEEDTYLK